MRNHGFRVLAVVAGASHINATVNLTSQPWLDTTKPVEERLQAFMSQLNHTQMYAMVQGDTVLSDHGTGISSCIGHISGNTSLGIPEICMGDGPAGVGNNLDYVTTFPAPVLAASTWNTTTMYRYSQAISLEHKEKGRNVVLAPTINIVRNPLWGRAAESFSEDTFLTERLAVASVMGIQSQKVLACPKHFAAYNQDTNRFGIDPDWEAYDSVVAERVMHEVYLPAFKAAVQEGNAGSVMCSYNRLNGRYTCENEWLLSILKDDWGFSGYVVADWYFSTRSTVDAANNGLDISMPGGSLETDYGFPAFYGDLLVEAVENGSVPFSRIEDMVARLWRPMFTLGVVDEDYQGGNSTGIVRSAAHLDVARETAAEGMVLLKNANSVLPLSNEKYKSIAVFGTDATSRVQVTENHGGFPIDTTMVVLAPLDSIANRSAVDGIAVSYSEGYPGNYNFTDVPSHMFGADGLDVTYWTTLDYSGPANGTVNQPNITSASYPSDLWTAWPQVFSSRHEGFFYPNTTGLYHFSLTGSGDALFYVNDELIANMSGDNFQQTVQGVAELTANISVAIRMDYSMGSSLMTRSFGITLGVVVGNETLYRDAIAKAEKADISIIFVNDRLSEGADSNTGLRLPGDQDALIEKIARASKKTVVVLNTNGAILMPWLDNVDAVIEAWYSGQEIGAAISSILFGDINPSGKLPVTFPKALGDVPIFSSGANSSGDMVEVHYDEGLLVGYKWYDAQAVEPLFPFGHGLSYTDFNLSDLTLEHENGHVKATARLTNIGGVLGQEVVQLYVSYPAATGEPPKVLKGFEKTQLQPGESVEVKIKVEEHDLRIWDAGWKLVQGTYTFMLGFSAADIRLDADVIIKVS